MGLGRVRVSVAVALLAAAAGTEAQAPSKTVRVGFVPLITEPNGNTEEFRKTLAELGYREGVNLVLESRWGDATRVREQVAELVRLKVDVLVVSASPAVRAAAAATQTIPIVANDMETDPVASGLVASLSRPGGNLTGIFLDQPDLSSKLLELMLKQKVVPDRAAVLWDASMDPRPRDALKAAAKTKGLQLEVLEVRSPHDFPEAFRKAAQLRAKFLIVLASPIMFVQRAHIAGLAINGRLPMVAQFREFAEAGGFMSYGPNIREVFHDAAVLVSKILKGARPADMPIERPSRLFVTLNMKTAETLGLTVSREILARADDIIR